MNHALPSLAAAAVLLVAPALAAPAAAEHRLGGGIHYWRNLDELADQGFDVEDEGQAPVLSYQYAPGGLLKLEIDLEYFEEGFGGAAEEAYSPLAFIVLGSGWYGALGGGVIVSSGFEDDVSDPFYAARVGLDMVLLPRFHLDINANYRFDAWSELGDADTDTVTLGAIVRFGL
jgi:hypothetical protein